MVISSPPADSPMCPYTFFVGLSINFAFLISLFHAVSFVGLRMIFLSVIFPLSLLTFHSFFFIFIFEGNLCNCFSYPGNLKPVLSFQSDCMAPSSAGWFPCQCCYSEEYNSRSRCFVSGLDARMTSVKESLSCCFGNILVPF